MFYYFSLFWSIPYHTIIHITLCCIISIHMQHRLPIFILCIPLMILLMLLMLHDEKIKKQTLTVLMAVFFAAFMYEYRANEHTYITEHIATQKSICAKIIDKKTLTNERYKECLIAEIYDNKNIKYDFLSPWRIHIYQYNTSRLTPGDAIAINISKKTAPIKNGDFSLYLCKEHIAATIFTSHKNKITLISRAPYSIHRWIWEKRNHMLNIYKKYCSTKTFELVSCIFWGDRTTIKHSHETKELFRKIGVSHYLARSGLHLIIFIFIWQWILKILCIPLKKRNIITFFLGLMYYLLTWQSISFARAFSLFFITTIASFNAIRTQLIHTLCLVCTTILLYNPMQLFFLDFQLTFALTATLIWHSSVEYQMKLNTTKNH